MLELSDNSELTLEMKRSVIEASLELEELASRGVLTDECRSFPSDAVLEHASPGYVARRRRLRNIVRELALDLYGERTALLPMLTTLRAVCATTMSEAGIRKAIQQLVLAEVSTACVAASYSAALRADGAERFQGRRSANA